MLTSSLLGTCDFPAPPLFLRFKQWSETHLVLQTIKQQEGGYTGKKSVLSRWTRVMPLFIKLSFGLYFLRSKIWLQLKFHKPHAVLIVCANWKQSAWRLRGHLLCREFSSGALLQKCLKRGWSVALGEAAIEFMLQKDYFLILHPLYCHFFLDAIKLQWTCRSIPDGDKVNRRQWLGARVWVKFLSKMELWLPTVSTLFSGAVSALILAYPSDYASVCLPIITLSGLPPQINNLCPLLRLAWGEDKHCLCCNSIQRFNFPPEVISSDKLVPAK